MRACHAWGIGFAVWLCVAANAPRPVHAQDKPAPGSIADPSLPPAAASAPAAESQGTAASTAEQPAFTIERMAPPSAANEAPASGPTAGAPARALRQRWLRPAPDVRAQAQEHALPDSFQAVLAVSYVLGPVLAIGGTAWIGAPGLIFFAAPVITHFAYLDIGGGLISLFAYPATVIVGGLVGFALDTSQCGDDESFCGFGGVVAGGLVGMVAWPLIDVLVLAPATWRASHPPESSASIIVLPGGLALRWNARF